MGSRVASTGWNTCWNRSDWSRAGRSTQNAYVESFAGTFMDERVDENWFEPLAQARQAK